MIDYPHKLTDEVYEYIKGEATHVLVQDHIRLRPILGQEIAMKEHIKLIPYSTLSGKKLEAIKALSKDGAFEENGNEDCIYYNNCDRPQRQNWTILHELGHFFLDHIGRTDTEEREADFFAKFIIAPPILVYKIKAQDPDDIYENFKISSEASQYSFNYYQKWLRHYKQNGELTDYEQQLLDLYNLEINNLIAS